MYTVYVYSMQFVQIIVKYQFNILVKQAILGYFLK